VKRIGGGVWIGRLGKTRVAYLVRGKRVRTVAIAGPEARSRKTLREHLAMVTRVGTKARSSFVTAPGTAPVTPQNAAPLVQKHDPEKYALFCDLGL
jgi:hypothetical protein